LAARWTLKSDVDPLLQTDTVVLVVARRLHVCFREFWLWLF